MAKNVENDLSFLQIIYEIIRRLFVAPSVGSGHNREAKLGGEIKPLINHITWFYRILSLHIIEKDSHDVHQKVTDLKNRLQRGREIVDKMPGIQHTREEQMKHIEVLRKQLITKCDLIKKYKNFHTFNLSR
uniref:Mediator of RNA polymerase II transcription subunit 9 n=1 Tax=Octopus bimaculoides TaxID=37653 RepID=A0A0L8HKX1_OCTBM